MRGHSCRINPLYRVGNNVDRTQAGACKTSKLTPEEMEEEFKRRGWDKKLRDGKPTRAVDNVVMQYGCERFKKGQL